MILVLEPLSFDHAIDDVPRDYEAKERHRTGKPERPCNAENDAQRCDGAEKPGELVDQETFSEWCN